MEKKKREYPVDLGSAPFIDRLKEHHFVILPNPILLGYDGLSKDARLCYGHLLRYGLFSLLNGHVDPHGNPIVFMSKETLSTDMDVSRQTVSRYLTELKSVGLVGVRMRGHGKTDELTIYAPKEIGKRYTSTSEPTSKNATPQADLLSQKCDTIYKEENPIKKDMADAARAGSVNPHMVQDKVDALIAQRLAQPKKEKKSTVKEPKQNANTLMAHFSSQYRLSVGGTPPLVTGKERKQAKELIDHYGYDFVLRLIDWTLQNWDTFKRTKNLDGLPTISVIYGFRAYVTAQLDAVTPKQAMDEEEESAW